MKLWRKPLGLFFFFILMMVVACARGGAEKISSQDRTHRPRAPIHRVPRRTAWISWKEENTQPLVHSFRSEDVGEFGWYTSAKVAYDIEALEGDEICVVIGSKNARYSWYVMVYWDHRMHTFGSWLYPLASGEVSCFTLFSHLLEGTVTQAHYIGLGHGGTIAVPRLFVIPAQDRGIYIKNYQDEV